LRTDLAGALGRLREGTSLWKPLLMAVLATLMVEALLANYLGGLGDNGQTAIRKEGRQA
jgi:hypothetical protein